MQTAQALGSQKIDDYSLRESDELLKPLLNSAVKSILIKGEPGTGKTTLAFELLRLYGKGIYLSTRLSREQSKDHHPDLDYLFENGNVMEINAQDYDIKRSSTASYTFQDLRFSNPQNVVTALLDGMQKIKEPLVIMDSWDAIANRTERIERLKVEQSLTLMALGNEAKLLFISEEPQLTTTDYLVDAVVTLQNGLFDERRIRRIQWNKIRGSAMVHWSNLYTLSNGRFTVFSQHMQTWQDITKPKVFKPLPHYEKFYSTGSLDFDNFLGGGMRKGSFVLVEFGKYVGSAAFNPISSSIRCNFILNNGASLTLPSPGVSGNRIKESVSLHIPDKLLHDNLRLAYFQLFTPDPCFFLLDPTSATKSLELLWTEAKKIKGEENRPCVYSIGSETLENVFQHEDSTRFVQGMVQRTRHLGDVLYVVLRHGSPFAEELSNMSDIHLRLNDIEGTMVIQRLKPWSQLYTVVYDYSPGYPRIKLVPFV